MSIDLALWPRVIIHADMDAYYAAVETLDQPRLSQVPLIIGGRSPRSVVCTANYLARRFGIKSAMPMSRALRLCPDAVVIPPRHGRYQEVSHHIMTVFREFTPLVEPLSLDEAYLDLSESAGAFAGPKSLGRALKAAVHRVTGGLTVSVGISTSKFVAKVASDFQKPDGLTIVDASQVHDFIRPLPASRLWSAGPRTVERLEKLGLHLIGEVADAHENALIALGRQGQFLRDLAQGIDHRRVIPYRPAKSVGWERTVDTDLKSKEEILPLLRTAASEVERRLQARSAQARGVRIKLKTQRFAVVTRQKALGQSTRESSIFFDAAQALLNDLKLDQPVRLVGLTAYDLLRSGQPEQLSLFGFDQYTKTGADKV